MSDQTAARQAAAQPAAILSAEDAAAAAAWAIASEKAAAASPRATPATTCPHCHGSGVDPEDEGDYDYTVHMHNPFTVGPCPRCNGTGRK
jgi:hypothetical protein